MIEYLCDDVNHVYVNYIDENCLVNLSGFNKRNILRNILFRVAFSNILRFANFSIHKLFIFIVNNIVKLSKRFFKNYFFIESIILI